MIYTVVTTEYGRVSEVKSFRSENDAFQYFKCQNEWALESFGKPNEDNDAEIVEFEDFGEAELVFYGGDCRILITTHCLN